jgi:predicted AAA+ superfamily ATPase
MLAEHLKQHRQMVFLSGPRQVGKTTSVRLIANHYLNWDVEADRRLLLGQPAALVTHLGLDRLSESGVLLALDELHKFPRWKGFLKGLFDRWSPQLKMIVTGSSRLDVYRRSGDSLMGRYFIYRMHPLSVGEILRQEVPHRLVRPPAEISTKDFSALWEHGGYPEPFLKRDGRFTTRWQSLRLEQCLKEDIRDLTHIHELSQIETLGRLLVTQAGRQVVYSNLSQEVHVAVDTVRRWINALGSLHFGFLLRPWFRNVAKSLRKEPRWYPRDWCSVEDPGARAETFIACHLLKAAEGWTDLGLGKFELCYLRDKDKREVDFVVVQNGKPWFLVECKKKDDRLSDSLSYFQKQTAAPHAFQAILEMDYVNSDCFSRKDPVIVPAKTLLSQLL